MGNLKRVVQKVSKAVALAAGVAFTALGIIGIVLPVLPTTPFLLLAAACFAYSSERMHRWLLNNRLFGSFIRNYREGKGISLMVKILTVTFLWTTIIVSALFFMPYTLGKLLLILIATAVSIHILTRPTYRQASSKTISGHG